MSLQDRVDEVTPRLREAGTDLADVEVKKAAGGLPKSLPETISAFTNSGGGLIILGIDEETGFIPVPIKAKSLAVGLAGICRDNLEPAVQAEIDIV